MKSHRRIALVSLAMVAGLAMANPPDNRPPDNRPPECPGASCKPKPTPNQGNNSADAVAQAAALAAASANANSNSTATSSAQIGNISPNQQTSVITGPQTVTGTNTNDVSNANSGTFLNDGRQSTNVGVDVHTGGANSSVGNVSGGSVGPVRSGDVSSSIENDVTANGGDSNSHSMSNASGGNSTSMSNSGPSTSTSAGGTATANTGASTSAGGTANANTGASTATSGPSTSAGGTANSSSGASNATNSGVAASGNTSNQIVNQNQVRQGVPAYAPPIYQSSHCAGAGWSAGLGGFFGNLTGLSGGSSSIDKECQINAAELTLLQMTGLYGRPAAASIAIRIRCKSELLGINDAECQVYRELVSEAVAQREAERREKADRQEQANRAKEREAQSRNDKVNTDAQQALLAQNQALLDQIKAEREKLSLVVQVPTQRATPKIVKCKMKEYINVETGKKETMCPGPNGSYVVTDVVNEMAVGKSKVTTYPNP